MSDEGMLLARFPVGMSVDLFTALGGLVSAALAELGELQLGASQFAEEAARLLFATDLSQRQVAAALQGASRAIDPDRAREFAEAEPVEDDGVQVGHLRHDEATGTVTANVGGPTADAHARELAAELAAVMLPAMDEVGASNYLAWSFRAPSHPGQEWELTIRRPDGLSPHTKQVRYEQVLTEIAGGKRSPRVLAREVLAEMRAPGHNQEAS